MNSTPDQSRFPGFEVEIHQSKWKISRMITSVKADRGRLSIRGVKDGQRYLVQEVPEGWFVMPEPTARTPKRRREWEGPKRDLTEHLDALASEGLIVERSMDEEAPRCRF